MGFLERLQTWLRAERRPVPGHLPSGIDPQRLLAALHTHVHMSGPLSAGQSQLVAACWNSPERIERFVRAAVWRLRLGVGAHWDGARLAAWVDVLFDAVFRSPSTVEDSTVDGFGRATGALALQLNQVLAFARERLESDSSVVEDDVAQWCVATGAVDTSGNVTAVGRTLARLVGRDAVHFILELEIALSIGWDDPFRVGRQALRLLVDGNTCDFRLSEGEEGAPFANLDTMVRLHRLGVVWRDEGPDFGLSEDAADTVRSVLEPAPHPVRALVHAARNHELGRVAAEATGAPASAAPDMAYARLVVHELRNLLLPLSSAHDRLWTELTRSEPDVATLQHTRDRIERVMTRLVDFVSDSARLSAAAAPEPFELRPVIDEAVRATEPDRNGRIAVHVVGEVRASVEGPRSGWVYLLVNLLRNAAQVRRGPGNVWIETSWDNGGWLHLYVDDDGPGIPVDLHERVFDQGTSLRGGSGLGLFEGRNTVVQTGGTMRCEDSPRGGARFHVHVPARVSP